jgi:hypothetical protein
VEFALRLYFVFEEFPITEVIFQNDKRNKKEIKKPGSNLREEAMTM